MLFTRMVSYGPTCFLQKEMKLLDDFGSLLLVSIVFVGSCIVEALNNGVALTPPMGWMSWLRFECNLRCDIDLDNCIRYVMKSLVNTR